MASTVSTPSTGHPHIVALVLQSKKALQQGEQLCSRAHALSNASAQAAVDVLALDAKVKWITGAVLEQLKLAADVAKCIEQKRGVLDGQAREWDTQRAQRADALDAVLDALGAQVVPPDFHQPLADGDVFGPQLDDGEDDGAGAEPTDAEGDGAGLSPGTVKGEVMAAGVGAHRAARRRTERADRTRWKTLRDFVDERGIEEAVEQMEGERAVLDDVLAGTAGYPESIWETVAAMRASLPSADVSVPSMPIIQEVVKSQEETSLTMARHLEGLAAHYGQMAEALRDNEAGEEIGEEDVQAMTRDVDELPSIIAELEAGVNRIQSSRERLLGVQANAQNCLDSHSRTLDDLDDLGEVMAEMLERQQRIEMESEAQLLGLHDYLFNLENLQTRYTAYQFAYNKLLLEMGRRRQYQDAAERIVRGMITQLEALTEEERVLRETFRVDHGDHLPEDLCLSIDNPPTKWDVLPVPWIPHEGGGPLTGEREVLPDVDIDLLMEAKERVANGEGGFGAAGSIGSL